MGLVDDFGLVAIVAKPFFRAKSNRWKVFLGSRKWIGKALKLKKHQKSHASRTLGQLLSTNSYYVLQAALIDINSQVV